MRFSVTATLAACCASAHAFSDSTPFILFSTTPLSSSGTQQQLQTSSSVASTAGEILASCPTNRYIVVSQPDLNAVHLAAKGAVPRLQNALATAEESLIVSEMTGDFNLQALTNTIRDSCADRDGLAIRELALLPLSSSSNIANTLKQNDNELGRVLAEAGDSDLTVIYTAGSRTHDRQAYTAEFAETMNTELKRQLHSVGKRASDDWDDLPLFEKYQYFTPGIFMAIVVVLILLSILYVGISALGSLEVPYGAFDKDMGPAAQKKQQ